jgi:hypothetical protein
LEKDDLEMGFLIIFFINGEEQEPAFACWNTFMYIRRTQHIPRNLTAKLVRVKLCCFWEQSVVWDADSTYSWGLIRYFGSFCFIL